MKAAPEVLNAVLASIRRFDCGDRRRDVARQGKPVALYRLGDGEIDVARKRILDFDEIDAADLQHLDGARCLSRRFDGDQEEHATKLLRQWPLQERPGDDEARPDQRAITDFLSHA